MSRARYIVVDKVTEKADWDDELYETFGMAVMALTGPRQEYVDSDKVAVSSGKQNWREVYKICRVEMSE